MKPRTVVVGLIRCGDMIILDGRQAPVTVRQLRREPGRAEWLDCSAPDGSPLRIYISQGATVTRLAEGLATS